MSLFIRPEVPQDFDSVYDVTLNAFKNAEHTDGDEQNLVNRLRKSDAYIPELSLVAEQDGKIVGHIMFTKAKIGDKTVLALAPVSVMPDYQGTGIGGALIRAGHKKAAEMGYDVIVLIGHKDYYPRFGYVDAARFGIQPPFDLPEGVFMAINLQDRDPDCAGTLEYPQEFFVK